MSQFSRYAMIGVLPWICTAPFSYGFAIAELNQIQAAMSCKHTEPGAYGLPICVPMDDAAFSVVTSAFIVGGFVSSVFTNKISDPYGRKQALQINALLVAAGSALLAFGSSVPVLAIGRFVVGLGGGIALCVTPSYLAECAPQKIRDTVGILNQLSVVIAILISQLLGFYFASPGSWRTVFVAASGFALLSFIIGLRMPETPAWLAAHDKKVEARAVSASLWKTNDGNSGARGAYDEDDVESALLREREPLPAQTQPSATILQCFKSAELRRPLIIVILVMFTQQISGINAVMYYSTSILSEALPDAAAYISLAVVGVNVVMTFPPIFVIERYGQRKILLYSVISSIISLVLLGFSLNYNFTIMSSIGTLLFVSCFAFGLGPIPFVILPEVSPLFAVSALSSIAISLNWLVNFVVGLTFLSLRNYLAGADRASPGNIFLVFAFLLTISAIAFFRRF